MKLKQLLAQKGSAAVTVAPDATVATAIQTMYQQRVGSVIVPATTGEPLGILTERDILRLYAEGRGSFETLHVKDCMTTDVVIGNPDDEADAVLAMMTERRFRHLPVMQANAIIGLISIGDLVKAKLEETAQEAKALRDYIHT